LSGSVRNGHRSILPGWVAGNPKRLEREVCDGGLPQLGRER
jgi:hypothetical protein